MIFYRCTLGTLALFSNTLEFFLLKLMEIFFTSLFFTQQQDLREGMTLSKGRRGGIWSDFRLCKRILAPSQWTLFCLIPNLVPFLLSPPRWLCFPCLFLLGKLVLFLGVLYLRTPYPNHACASLPYWNTSNGHCFL